MTGALCIVTRRAEFFHSENKQKTKGENTTVKVATVFGIPWNSLATGFLG